MSQPTESTEALRDPRTVQILAKSIYRELRASGLSEQDVLAVAGELLTLITSEFRRKGDGGSPAP
jgi:hypothetical protein